jgi:hypothetical protein
MNLAQRFFKLNLITHFLISIYEGVYIEASFTKSLACGTTPCFKIKNSSLKGGIRKNPKEKSFHRRRPALLHND